MASFLETFVAYCHTNEDSGLLGVYLKTANRNKKACYLKAQNFAYIIGMSFKVIQRGHDFSVMGALQLTNNLVKAPEMSN